MSAMRLLAVTIVLMAVAASATYTGAGCGVMPAHTLFGNSTIKCQKGMDCLTAYCKCIGTTAGANFTCVAPTTAPNCTTAAMCVASKISCLNKAADDSTCVALKKLKMSNLAVAGGQLYNASAAYESCKYEACKMLNSTAGNCTLDLRTLCASPVVFVGTLRLKGDFTKILADPAAKAKFTAALATDLAAALGVTYVIITRIYIAGTSRRQAVQTLIIEFQVPGVSIQNTNFSAALGGLTDASWLKAALVEYKAVNGPNSSFTFGGISAGSSSSAVFTPSTGGSTASGNKGSAASSAAGSASSSASGAATQSLVAAVVVAVIGAMLF